MWTVRCSVSGVLLQFKTGGRGEGFVFLGRLGIKGESGGIRGLKLGGESGRR